MTTSIEMPKYKCHKEVSALKIAKVERKGGFVYLTPEDTHYSEIKLPIGFYHKNKPEKGGYFVQYKGGYKSYSPRREFEEGYTKIN